jgi:cellulose synthase/poly-beta-1,6-N-acetylglucosamine synthase-like glycosyltransferase
VTGLAWILMVAAVAFALPLLVAVGVLVLQTLGDASTARCHVGDGRGWTAPRPSLVVLVPAHNEEAGIAEALATVSPQLAPGDRLLVVADNCADATAAVARAAGAQVVERNDSSLRGKGYALGFGVDYLRDNPPSAVVIVDADCKLALGALDALMHSLVDTGRPVQALYLMQAPADAALGRRLAQFAWRVRNWTRPAGWHRLGLPCQLMGTGMAFSWAMVQDAQLANASIVEDMKLGIDLAARGTPPIFCDRALVTSYFPDSAAASGTQRTRWEHGHIEMILREVPAMLRTALVRRDVRLLGMALDLAVPPLALLAGLLGLDWLLGLAVWLAGGGAAALGLASALLAMFLVAILMAWATRGRNLVRLSELLAVPLYILAKVPIYLRFIARRQKDWVRTDRK